MPPTPQATQWIADLATNESWNREKAEAFAGYLDLLPEIGEDEPGFRALEAEQLKTLVGRDEGLGDRMAERYGRWVRSTGFTFAYCDVVIGRIEAVFAAGSLTAKAAAAIAAAELGASHNRWFVMGCVLSMCGPLLAGEEAERIALEIQVEDMRSKFIRCAAGIRRSLDAFHPQIAAVLKKGDA